MKKCPKCGQPYFDDNQNYCLTDGTTLVYSNPTQPTVSIDPALLAQPAKQGVSPLFAYLTIGLLCLLLGGGVAALFMLGIFSKNPGDQALLQQPKTNEANANKQPENQKQEQPVVQVNPNPAPRAAVPPPQSKTKGYKNYAGSVGGANASFDLVWNNDKTISGSFYYSSNPGVVYTVSGSNYVEGTSQLRIVQGGNPVGQMNLSKSIEGNILCWQGYFSNGNQYVRFCRRR